MAWAPLGIPVYIALVAAMAMDAFAYSAINGTLVGPEGLRLIEKLEGGRAAGLPVAIYLTVQLRRRSRGEADLLLDRSSLEILDLRSQVKHAELLLKEQRAKYNYIKDTLSRYVSEDVANTLINDPSKIALGGETKEVTILFADVRGYSSLSEHVEPTELIDLLNRYLAKVSRQILDQHGMINEFEGDGILAVFGAPLELQHHAEHATEAALRMLEAVKQLNQEWQADGTHKKWQNAGIKDLAIRIGLHSGKVVAGNIGTEARMKYAVIGDTVNTASRIEALNKILDTSLLLSRPTFERLNPQRQMAAHPLGSHQLKGKAEPVEVFTLVS